MPSVFALVACLPAQVPQPPPVPTDLPGLEGGGTDPLWDPEALPTFWFTTYDPDWASTLWSMVPNDEDCGERPSISVDLRFENPMTGQTETYVDVGLRWRGHSALDDIDPGDRVGFKVGFEEFVPDRRFHGVKKLNLMGTEGDATLMREVLAYRVLAHMGVPTPRTNYARVIIDGEFMGLYPLTEEPDDTAFLEAHLGDDSGHLYRQGGYCGGRAAFLYDGEDTEEYVEIYEPRGKTAEQDLAADLIPMISCTVSTDPADFENCLAAWVDEDSWLSLAAADVVMPDVDGLIGNGQNFMLYFDPAMGRFRVWAWDKDQAFAEYNLADGSTLYRAAPPWGDDYANALGNRLIEARRETYCLRVLDAADRIHPSTFLGEIQELADFLDGHIAADPIVQYEDWSLGLDDIRALVVDRHATITALAEECAPLP